MKNNNQRIIWIDIGTHKGKETKALFSNTYFSLLILKYFVKFILFPSSFNLKYLILFLKLIPLRIKLSKSIKTINLVLVEPNPLMYSNWIYKYAKRIYCFAIGKIKKEAKLGKLYIAENSMMSEGLSIYKNKSNISIEEYIDIAIISPIALTKLIKKSLKISKKDKVILRLNCEGSEDIILREFIDIFEEQLLLCLGSIDDVRKIFGIKKYQELSKYLFTRNLSFIDFHADPISWSKAYKSILNIL